MPVSLSIKNSLGSAANNYTYSEDGKKLKVEMKYSGGIKITDYVDNMIYENGTLKRILVDGGYIKNNKLLIVWELLMQKVLLKDL